MKKLQNMEESKFLRLFFLFFSLCFLVAAPFTPGREQMLTGLWEILTSHCKVTTNYFYVGGISATFLNMGLVGLISWALFFLPGAKATNASTLAVILTVGFGSWGINILNIWPTFLGVALYCLVKKEKLGANANAMLFSTGIAPIISELLLRYPQQEAMIGFNWLGLALALVVGVCIGFFLPAGLAHSPKVHKGFDLYSAALPIGMTAFLLNAILYNTMGVGASKALNTLEPESMGLTFQSGVNIFCCCLFGICIVVAFLMGCKPKDYWNLLKDPELVLNFSATYGNATFLMNVGVYGLFILGYYNLIGASFNGITFGIIFCMLACCNSGSHPANVWPIMLGYIVASMVMGWVAPLLGGNFTYTINAQAIVVGLCYANGLSPISDKYGWRYGFLAAVLHYLLVTSVPNMHGGFCLYNGGFTAALICLMLVPELERFFKTKAERREAKLTK